MISKLSAIFVQSWHLHQMYGVNDKNRSSHIAGSFCSHLAYDVNAMDLDNSFIGAWLPPNICAWLPPNIFYFNLLNELQEEQNV